ncbi:unnamed protein product [Ambrosiozyma monospora]|uniref:Unnamed protein product n=1 Tax=Ambrosiozyma monospora TaxID=43982 RepID=A0ACB5U8C0_AMBMO|nr:unnamed protein product [Ambrosiozyma monospora]
MDVHPPLAKLLFASVGYLGGFKGDFEFAKIGDVFPKDVPYVLMRELSALTGLGTVILSYLTLRNTGCKPITAFVTSSLLIIESANVTISRYILLDSPLIFFIAATVYSYTKFQVAKPFTFDWFKSLFATGVSLGLACSSKWVGLFTVAYVGISTVIRLWLIVGDLSVSPTSIAKHIAFRLTFMLDHLSMTPMFQNLSLQMLVSLLLSL